MANEAVAEEVAGAQCNGVQPGAPPCNALGCPEPRFWAPSVAVGLCRGHYERWLDSGEFERFAEIDGAYERGSHRCDVAYVDFVRRAEAEDRVERARAAGATQ